MVGRVDDVNCQVVIVVMRADRQSSGRFGTEQGEVFRVLTNGFRGAGTADMMVEANDAVRCGHDEMQIVRDHQDAAIEAVAQTADQLVELDLA